jgi:hypothetical protein
LTEQGVIPEIAREILDGVDAAAEFEKIELNTMVKIVYNAISEMYSTVWQVAHNAFTLIRNEYVGG